PRNLTSYRVYKSRRFQRLSRFLFIHAGSTLFLKVYIMDGHESPLSNNIHKIKKRIKDVSACPEKPTISILATQLEDLIIIDLLTSTICIKLLLWSIRRPR